MNWNPNSPTFKGYGSMGLDSMAGASTRTPKQAIDYSAPQNQGAWLSKVREGWAGQAGMTDQQRNQQVQMAVNNRQQSMVDAANGGPGIDKLAARGDVSASSIGRFDPNAAPPSSNPRATIAQRRATTARAMPTASRQRDYVSDMQTGRLNLSDPASRMAFLRRLIGR